MIHVGKVLVLLHAGVALCAGSVRAAGMRNFDQLMPADTFLYIAMPGYDTMVKAPLRPRVTETKRFDGYTRQRVEIQSEPGVVMPFYRALGM